MKKRFATLLLLVTTVAVLATGCAPPHQLPGPPPKPPGAPR